MIDLDELERQCDQAENSPFAHENPFIVVTIKRRTSPKSETVRFHGLVGEILDQSKTETIVAFRTAKVRKWIAEIRGQQ